MLISQSDTNRKKGTLTDIDGNFNLTNVDAGNYSIRISYVGFKNLEKEILVNEDKDLGILKLEEDVTLLKDIKVEERQIRVQQKGDTTEYKADAYKTNPDANADDLVQKMPGITKEGGTIK